MKLGTPQVTFESSIFRNLQKRRAKPLHNTRSMFIRFYKPRPILAGCIKGYQIVHVQTPAINHLPVLPFPPHAAQQFIIYARDRATRLHYRNRQHSTQPNCIVVGPQVSRVDITAGRDMLTVATFFEPGGLHRLLGIPMYELFDDSLDISLVWNKEIRELEQRLRDTCDYDEMHEIVEAFLLSRLNLTQVEKHPIDSVFKFLQDTTQPLSLDKLADLACLSPRQFERKCHERLGLGPKVFNRIVRFSKAYRLKENRPDLSWLDVAIHCGYYDVQHLRRDFKEFAASTPTSVMRQQTRSDLRGYSSHDF